MVQLIVLCLARRKVQVGDMIAEAWLTIVVLHFTVAANKPLSVLGVTAACHFFSKSSIPNFLCDTLKHNL